MARIPFSTGKDAALIQALEREVSLCELLDRVLNKGAVLTGEIVVSVADIELLYVGLSLVISSVQTLLQTMHTPHVGRQQSDENA